MAHPPQQEAAISEKVTRSSSRWRTSSRASSSRQPDAPSGHLSARPASKTTWPVMLSDVEHLDTAALEDGLAAIRRAPRDAGTVELIVRRPTPEEREVVAEAQLDPAAGLVGDCWLERGSNATEDGSAHPDMQLTMMNARAAALIARARERWPLAA